MDNIEFSHEFIEKWRCLTQYIQFQNEGHHVAIDSKYVGKGLLSTDSEESSFVIGVIVTLVHGLHTV